MLWLILLLGGLLSIAFLLYSLRYLNSHQTINNEKSNIAIAQQKIDDLKEDITLGYLDAAVFEQAKSDINRSLAEELALLKNKQQSKQTPLWRLGSALLLVVLLMSSGIYALVGQSDISDKLDNLQTVKTLAGLEAFVKRNPENKQALKLLAASYFANKQLQKSKDYYQKAYALDNQDIDVLLEYAAALAALQNNRLTGESVKLIKAALEIDSKHIAALYLAGLVAYQQGQLTLTQKAWGRALAQMQPGSLDYKEMTKQLRFLEKEIAKEIVKEIASPTQVLTATDKEAASTRAISVAVSIDANLKNNLSTDSFVLIYAKNTQGMPAPLAIIRKQVKDLPVQVQLSDNEAMIAGHNLTNAKMIIVVARLSKSGQAIKQAGDIEVSSEPIDLDKTPTASINLILK